MALYTPISERKKKPQTQGPSFNTSIDLGTGASTPQITAPGNTPLSQIKEVLRPVPTTPQLEQELRQSLLPEAASQIKKERAAEQGLVYLGGDRYLDPIFTATLRKVGSDVIKSIARKIADIPAPRRTAEEISKITRETLDVDEAFGRVLGERYKQEVDPSLIQRDLEEIVTQVRDVPDDIFPIAEKARRYESADDFVKSLSQDQIDALSKYSKRVDLSPDQNAYNFYSRATGGEITPVSRIVERISDIRLPKRTAGEVDKILEFRREGTQAAENKIDEAKLSRDFAAENVEGDPLRKLSKYAAKSGEFEGKLPEVTGERGKGIFKQRGDQIIPELGYDDVEVARAAYEDYVQKRATLKEIKRDVSEQISDFRSRKNILEEVNTLIRQENRKRIALVRSVKDFFNLTDTEVRKITKGKDYRTMTGTEFQEFMDDLRRGAELASRLSDRRGEIRGLIEVKEFIKTENLRKALALPPIEDMTFEQLNFFDEVLSQYQQGDEFLGVRQLETVKNTDLKDIRTIREARERLAKQAGVPIQDLLGVKFTELDRFRYDPALQRQNPFYKVMTEETAKAILNADYRFYKLKTELNEYLKKARSSRKRGVLERLVPTDKNIFKWLEADDLGKQSLARGMTPQELEAARFIRNQYIFARDYLVKNNVLEKYRSDYITHIRRGFLEAWKEDGLISAFKETFQQYQQDEAYFNILDQKTREVLPLEKFFQFSMRRTGELEPTQNVSRAVLSYFRAFERKLALDSLVPKLDIYAHSLSPRELTPRGLEVNDSLKRFVREWINSKKGRVTDAAIVKPGGKIDWGLRTGTAFTRFMDLGFSLTTGSVASIGDQLATLQVAGGRKYVEGLRRLTTPKGRELAIRYKNFVGEPIWERLSDASLDIGDQFTSAMFALFSESSRKANQVFLLGHMTPDEWRRGSLSPARLAELQLKMARSRAIPGLESVFGKTAPIKGALQYKSWAVPVLSSTIDNVEKLGRAIKTGDKAYLKSENAAELFRTILISSIIGFGVYGLIEQYKNKRDRTFSEDLAFKAARDSLTLIGALDPSLYTATPRLLDFLNDIAVAAKQIVTVERYKSGENEGDLKGTAALQRIFTPSAVRQFTRGRDSNTSSGTKLPRSSRSESPRATLPKSGGLERTRLP